MTPTTAEQRERIRQSPESRLLAEAYNPKPRRVSDMRWEFPAITDRSEPKHYVDFLGGRLYCSCRGFVGHHTCKHVDYVKEKELNEDEYPMTREVAMASSFAGAVAIQRTPTELRQRLSDMKSEAGLVAEFFRDVMVPCTPGEVDGDYGIIPGTDKPTLLKPGAEKLCELYGYAPTIKNREEMIDHATGHYRCVVTIALVQKGTGAVVAEGVGECNTREARYFYRWVFAEQVPSEIDKSMLKTREGKSKKTGRPWKQYRLENDDLHTLWNTVLKMAKKRALVDATLSATRSSGIFSQSMQGINDWIEAEYTEIPNDAERDTQPAPETPPAPPTEPTREPGGTIGVGPEYNTLTDYFDSIIDKTVQAEVRAAWMAIVPYAANDKGGVNLMDVRREDYDGLLSVVKEAAERKPGKVQQPTLG